VPVHWQIYFGFLILNILFNIHILRAVNDFLSEFRMNFMQKNSEPKLAIYRVTYLLRTCDLLSQRIFYQVVRQHRSD
jgi:hypothetical protein